jgi:hypothetical protein
MSYQTADGVDHISTNDVRAGRTAKGMTRVLTLSTSAIILLVAAVYFVFL